MAIDGPLAADDAHLARRYSRPFRCSLSSNPHPWPLFKRLTAPTDQQNKHTTRIRCQIPHEPAYGLFSWRASLPEEHNSANQPAFKVKGGTEHRQCDCYAFINPCVMPNTRFRHIYDERHEDAHKLNVTQSIMMPDPLAVPCSDALTCRI